MRKWQPLAPIEKVDAWILGAEAVPCRSGAYAPFNMFTQKVGAGPASPGTTLRAWCALLPDDTAIGYIGTTTKLYTYDGVSTFTDKSKGGGYTNTATDWSFAQFGNYSIATNRVDAVQVRDASGAAAFADLAGTPPKARIAVTQADQVLLFDLNDGAEKGNAFASCAPGDHTDWSGAGATTATAIRHRPGRINAAVAFRDYVLVFKKSSVYRLTYTGSTFKWKVELIAAGRGAWGKHDVVVCGDTVVFSGPGGAWTFDGASFQSTTDLVGPLAIATGGSYFSPASQNVFLWRNNSPSIPTNQAYNVVSDRWGPGAQAITLTGSVTPGAVVLTGEPAALNAFSSGTIGVTYPDVAWLIGLSNNPCVVKSDTVYGSGTPFGTKFELWGSVEGLAGKGFPEEQVTRFSALYPKFATTCDVQRVNAGPGNTEMKLQTYYGNSPLDVFNNTSAVISSSSAQRRFDLRLAAVCMIPVITMDIDSGYAEIDDYTVKMKPAGAV